MMKYRLTVGIVLAIALLASIDVLAQSTSHSKVSSDRVSITFDHESFITTVRIVAKDGQVSWSDVLEGFCRVKGFDDAALVGHMPDHSFRLNRKSTRFTIAAMNRLMKKHIQFSIAKPTEQNEGALLIQLDRVALLSTKRRFKQILNQGTTTFLHNISSINGQHYGIKLDDRWAEAPLNQPLVIIVHGFQSKSAKFNSILKDLRKAKYPCGRFDYPNDQAISRSALLLAEQLKLIKKEQPNRKVALIAHSMGGLVCRAVIENPTLDPGNVSHLIMVATPNQGSLLAEFAFAFNIGESAVALAHKEQMIQFFNAIEDGLGEATKDLLPDSVFIKKLNARKRNPDVRYTLFLGTGGPMNEQQVQWMKTQLTQLGKRHRFVQFLGPRLNRILDDLDEVIKGKGDGVVAVKRGRLKGVEDTVILKFNHLQVMRNNHAPDEQQLRREILKRLGAK